MTSTDTLPAPSPELWQVPDEELAAALVVHQQAMARGYAHGLDLLGEALRRGLATTLGYRDEVRLLTGELRLSNREAKARIGQAAATQDTVSPSGARREAPLAATGQALREGVISREHVREIAELFARCPEAVSVEQRADSERHLLDLAAQAPPETVRKAATRIAFHWDQDGTPPAERDRDLAYPDREFHSTRTRAGGMRFSGHLDPETAATLEGLFGPLAKPRPTDDTGTPDVRTTAQRRGDALGEILDLAARTDDLTVQGGERAVITATITLAELETRVQDALLTVPGMAAAATVEQVRRWACEARLVPAIFGNQAEPLYLGRSSRTATPAQRRALALRDGGCSRPGCTRPPKWCSVHHVAHWTRDHGPTDIDVMILVCEMHHRELHHTPWEVRMVNGIPKFVPPSYVDPKRKPLRNHAHRAPP